MYVVCMWDFAKLLTVSTYIDVFTWDLDIMILRQSHTCDLNRCGVKGHLGVNELWFKFLKKGSLYPHTVMYFHWIWTQWSLGRVTHVTSTDLGQRSSWVNDLWFKFLKKKGHHIHMLRHIFMGLG